MSCGDLIVVDMSSDGYADFTLAAWNALLGANSPMESRRFWQEAASIDWASNHQMAPCELARPIAARLSLIDSNRLLQKAIDVVGELEELLERTDLDIPSEDEQEDFFFHLIGLGHSTVKQLHINPSVAIGIARDGGYVESFRYVLESLRLCYPLQVYVDSFRELAILSPSDAAPTLNTMRMMSSGVPGVVTRIDQATYHVVTPVDSRDVAIA